MYKLYHPTCILQGRGPPVHEAPTYNGNVYTVTVVRPPLVPADLRDRPRVEGEGAPQGHPLLHPDAAHHRGVPHRRRALQQLEDGQEARRHPAVLVFRGDGGRLPVRDQHPRGLQPYRVREQLVR